MEPVTHVLTGACLARSGFHKRVLYATAAMAVAAEFPDIDTMSSFWGPVSGFAHHRGLTHSFLGVPLEAALLLGCFALWHRLRERRSKRRSGDSAGIGRPPFRAGALYGLLLLALLSHLLLDYTNNYGLRPFLPFSDRWYAGSIVFIFDPLLFAMLVAGLLLPRLFQLIGREVGADERHGAGAGWARAALCGVVLLWSVRWWEHGRALQAAQAQTVRAPAMVSPAEEELAPAPGAVTPDATAPAANDAATPAPEPVRPLLPVRGVLANPDPLSIFRWYTVADFGAVYQLGTADTRAGSWERGRMLVKPAESATLAAAERSRLGQLYLRWAPMPYLTAVTGGGAATEPAADFEPQGGPHLVQFVDPRFLGEIPVWHRTGPPPLTGEVLLDADDRVVAEGMDGRWQKP